MPDARIYRSEISRPYLRSPLDTRSQPPAGPEHPPTLPAVKPEDRARHLRPPYAAPPGLRSSTPRRATTSLVSENPERKSPGFQATRAHLQRSSVALRNLRTRARRHDDS